MTKRSLWATLPLLAGLVLACAQAQDDQLWQKAQRLHREAIVVDTHSDTTSAIIDEGADIGQRSTRTHMDLPRMREGGLTAEFFAVYVDKKYVKENQSAHRALEMIDVVRHDIAGRYPNDVVLATSANDIRRAKAQGKIAALMGIEGGHAIEDSLRLLRDFYALGVRYMTLTHTNTNHWADSSGDAPRHNGLTDFGRQVVLEMNRLGMMVDISHVSHKTFADVIAVSKAPVIASHSSARALANHPRNMTDDMLRAIGKQGGVVMVNFYPSFIDPAVMEAERRRDQELKPQTDALRAKYQQDPARLAEELRKFEEAHPLPRATLATLIKHIDHIAKTAGIDHVGLGSDFDGIPTVPQGMEDVSKLPHITYELLKLGYSEGDVKKILGENLLRVFGAVERVSQQWPEGGK